MAYDEVLAQRIRQELGNPPGLVEKKMFGGVGFILRGNMACGVYKDDLIVRVSPAGSEAALANPHTRLMDITGKPMAGWILVAPEGVASSAELAVWVKQGLDYASTLPPK